MRVQKPREIRVIKVIYMIFELNNDERHHLGLDIVIDWEKRKLSNNTYIYLDGEVIRKHITVSETEYFERDMDVLTSNDVTLLPRKYGEPKKMNVAELTQCQPSGMCFRFLAPEIKIYNHYSYSKLEVFYTSHGGLSYNNLDDLRKWIVKWIKESSKKDIAEISDFKNAKNNMNLYLFPVVLFYMYPVKSQ